MTLLDIWNINVTIGAFVVILFCSNIMRCNRILKARYPEMNFGTRHLDETIITIIKIVFCSFCPIFNLIMFWTLITKDEQLIEDSVRAAYEKRMKELGEENDPTRS